MTAPTTRADHAELARIAEQCRLKADKLGCDEWRAPALLKQASRGLEALLSEIAALRARHETTLAGECPCCVLTRAECADAIAEIEIGRTQAERQRDELRKALERQCDNMSFVLNRVELHAWADKFSREVAEDRAFIASQGAGQ